MLLNQVSGSRRGGCQTRRGQSPPAGTSAAVAPVGVLGREPRLVPCLLDTEGSCVHEKSASSLYVRSEKCMFEGEMHVRKEECIFAPNWLQILPNIANMWRAGSRLYRSRFLHLKYSFCSIRQVELLQDLRTCALIQIENLATNPLENHWFRLVKFQ